MDSATIFTTPGSLEGCDVVLPSSLRPNGRGDVEEVVPAVLSGSRGQLVSHIVLLRPTGWQAAVKRAPTIKTWHDVQRIVQHMFFQDYETVAVLALDPKGKLLAIHEAASGGLGGAQTDMRHMFKVALLVGAVATVIVHNHPSGNPSPSSDDMQLTSAIVNAAHKAGVDLLDHVIVSSSGMAKSLLGDRLMGYPKKGPAYRVNVDPSADAEVDLRAPTAGGFTRRMWGGHGKLVVRTGLIPGKSGQLPIGSVAPVVRLMLRLDMEPEELVIIGTDGAQNMRGARLIRLSEISQTEQLTRDVLGFLLALSGHNAIIGYKVEGPMTRERMLRKALWIRQITDLVDPVIPCVDIVVLDSVGTFVSFYEAGWLTP